MSDPKEERTMRATELNEALGADVIALPKGAGETQGGTQGETQGAARLKILGTLINMSVPQGNYPREAVLAAMRDAGLDEGHAPREPTGRDAFRRATRSLAVSRVPVDTPSPTRLFGNERRYANILIRDARTRGQSIVRLAVREVVDSAGATLSHLPVAHLELTGGGALEAYPLVARLLPEEERLVEEAAEAYERARNHHDDAAVRNVITRAFDAGKGLSLLPSGGAYFVPAEHEGVALAVGRFAGELNDRLAATGEAGPRRIILMPTDLVDRESVRDDLACALAERVRKDARSLAGEMAELLNSGKKITERRQADLFERVRALKTYVSDYEAILEREVTDNRADLELAQRQAVKLLSRVEVR